MGKVLFIDRQASPLGNTQIYCQSPGPLAKVANCFRLVSTRG